MTDGPGWGSTVVRATVRGHDCLVFDQRPHSLTELLEGAARWGSREYLVEAGRRVTFSELDGHVHAVVELLVATGARPGDRVMLLARNSLEWVVTLWACVRLGAVAVLGNAWWGADEARLAVDTVSATLVFADPERAALLERRVKILTQAAVSEAMGAGGGSASVARAALLPQGNIEDEPAVILFTSGTTGAPKGAILSHRSVIANQQGFLALTKRLPSDLPDDHLATTSLLSTPLFHTGGLQAVMTALVTGGKLVFTTGRFDPIAVMDLIETERVTVWAGVPTMIQRVIEHPECLTRDLSSIRAIGLGGAPLPAHVLTRIPDVFPRARKGMSTNYGATEAGGIVSTASGPVVLERRGTAGRPLPHVEVRLGTDDEILIRSSAAMSGYWGDAVASPIDDEGWIHSGDIGRIDDEGYLYVVDRIKDIIIRGGENIAASHVELALCTHPAVSAAAVVGMPHHDLGEEVAAVVALREGLAVDPAELADHLAGRVARFELPSRWWIRSEPLPENATGKTDKRALKAAFPTAVAAR